MKRARYEYLINYKLMDSRQHGEFEKKIVLKFDRPVKNYRHIEMLEDLITKYHSNGFIWITGYQLIGRIK